MHTDVKVKILRTYINFPHFVNVRKNLKKPVVCLVYEGTIVALVWVIL